MTSSNSGSCVICGQSNLRSKAACGGCGARLPWVNANAASQSTSATSAKEELSNLWLQIASFLIPILGIALYFAYRDKQPKMGKTAIQAAAWGIAANLVLMIVMKK